MTARNGTIARKNVEVTREDLWRGIPGSASDCAVARALRRQFRDHFVMVYPHYVVVDKWVANLPNWVAYKVFWFDDHKFLRKFMRPFKFSLEFYEFRCPVTKPQSILS